MTQSRHTTGRSSSNDKYIRSCNTITYRAWITVFFDVLNDKVTLIMQKTEQYLKHYLETAAGIWITRTRWEEGPNDLSNTVRPTKVLLVPLPALIPVPAVVVLAETFLPIHVILLPQLLVFQHFVRTSDAQKFLMGLWVTLKTKTESWHLLLDYELWLQQSAVVVTVSLLPSLSE